MDHMLDVLVEDIEIDVGEELAGQVADWQPEMRRLVQEALVCRYQCHARRRAVEDGAIARIMEQDLAGELQPPRLGNFPGEQLEHNALVDRHEEVGEVALQIERWPVPVARDTADLVLDTIRGVKRAASGNAGAAVGDECVFESPADFSVQQMMNNAIAELGGPNFPGLR